MPRIDLLVLTSLSEAQPLVILEGGACHIPVVAPDVGSCREMLVDGSLGPGGIITPLVNPAATAKAIIDIISDPETRVIMGRNLRMRVERDYSHSNIIERYRAVYDHLVSGDTKA